jgi:23S rRNA (guanosine2251-2'-O)-methyltransferase
LANGSGGGPVDEIVDLAKKKKVVFHWTDRRKLEQLVGRDVVHQGVVAQVSPIQFASLDKVLQAGKDFKGPGPCALFLDGILDPHNLGSIIRTAVFFGVPGIVIPKWRAAGLTATVVRSSAGAARLVPIAQVANLGTAMEQARDEGIWLVGADMDGGDAKKADLPRPFALIMGGEGEGLHQLVRKKCDVIVRIEKKGGPGVDSLNVGVAAGILIHQFA